MASMSAILSPAQTADKPKLLDQVRDVIRRKHFSIRTEQTYVEWIKRYIFFHGKRHPNEMAEAEITAFLTHLARAGKVAASTQNQALSALLFLYREVLQQNIGWLDQVERALIRASSRYEPTDGRTALWKRIAVDGVHAVESQRCRSWLSPRYGS